MAIDPGFDTTHLISFSVAPKMNGYEGVRSKQFAKALLEQIQRMPEVTGAGFGIGESARRGIVEQRDDDRGRHGQAGRSRRHPQQPDQLRLFQRDGHEDRRRARLRCPRRKNGAGRPPGRQPRDGHRQSDFRQALPRRAHPLGVHIGFGRDPGTPTPIEIVGVVSDAKYRSLRNETEPQAFFAYFAGPEVGFRMYVRTMAAPEGMFATLRRAVQELDPNLPLFAMQTFETRVQRSLSNERLIASLSSVFGVLATLLAMIGLYGVMAYTVTQRTREIGIRMALGAVSRDVARMILRDVTDAGRRRSGDRAARRMGARPVCRESALRDRAHRSGDNGCGGRGAGDCRRARGRDSGAPRSTDQPNPRAAVRLAARINDWRSKGWLFS